MLHANDHICMQTKFNINHSDYNCSIGGNRVESFEESLGVKVYQIRVKWGMIELKRNKLNQY